MANNRNDMLDSLNRQRREIQGNGGGSNGRRGSNGGGGAAVIIVVLLLVIVILMAFTVKSFYGGNTNSDGEEEVSVTNDNNNSGEVRQKYWKGLNTDDVDEEDEEDEDEDEDENISEIDTSVINSYANAYTNYTDYGIIVDNLTTGYSYSYNSDNTFSSSALSQIVILDVMSDICNEQDVDIDDEYWYFSYLHNGKENPNSKYQDGTVLDLRSYIEDIAVYGDNNKANSMVDWIGYRTNRENGFDTINSYLRKNGYSDTLISRKIFTNASLIDTSAPANVTTPEDIYDMFKNLIDGLSFGNKRYMKNLFKCLDSEGEALGLKKYVPSYYDVCAVNACNTEVDHDVMLIENGGTKVFVVIMSQTESNRTQTETSEDRNNARQAMLDYILETQFNGD